jgi:hypothetical protein
MRPTRRSIVALAGPALNCVDFQNKPDVAALGATASIAQWRMPAVDHAIGIFFAEPSLGAALLHPSQPLVSAVHFHGAASILILWVHK